MRKCECCDLPVYGPGPFCEGCEDGECSPIETWHCFTGHCDGSGCTYPGECEGLTVQDAIAAYAL